MQDSQFSLKKKKNNFAAKGQKVIIRYHIELFTHLLAGRTSAYRFLLQSYQLIIMCWQYIPSSHCLIFLTSYIHVPLWTRWWIFLPFQKVSKLAAGWKEKDGERTDDEGLFCCACFCLVVVVHFMHHWEHLWLYKDWCNSGGDLCKVGYITKRFMSEDNPKCKSGFKEPYWDRFCYVSGKHQVPCSSQKRFYCLIEYWSEIELGNQINNNNNKKSTWHTYRKVL